MKRIFIYAAFLVSLHASAQMSASKLPSIDKSPMDMSYYPVNYPLFKIENKVSEPAAIRLIYSRPQMNGRNIFGELQEYGKIWRLGANEATEIEFFKDVKISGKKINKGRYTLYCIPYENKWTLILNSETDTWGSFKYDQAKDILRTDLPIVKNESTEALTMIFEKNETGANLLMFWENIKTSLPITFN